jgi:hypothetical protein
MKSEVCPICKGTGVVPGDFYPDTFSDGWQECRTCRRSGAVSVAENANEYMEMESYDDTEFETPVTGEEVTMDEENPKE